MGLRGAGGLDRESAEAVDVVLRARRLDGVTTGEDHDIAKIAGMHFAAAALDPER
jgi:hypothetical protein